MRRGFIQSMLTACLAIGAAPVFADIVVQQLPYQGGGPASDTLFRNQLNQVVWQQEADNILLSSPAIVRQVSWWGFYGGSGAPVTPPPPVETMRIRFYGARLGDGLPDDGNILLEELHTNALRAATGILMNIEGRPAEYRYQINLTTPIELDATTLYWLEIVQVGDVDSAFRWETGFGAVNGHAFQNGGFGDWQQTSGSFAFELSTVPEPQSVGFFLVTIWICRSKSKRMEDTSFGKGRRTRRNAAGGTRPT